MSKQVLVPLADGFEEIEAVTIVDILRRAGAQVTTAGLHKRNVTGAHAIAMIADSVLQEELDKDWDMIVLPGGTQGAQNLAENEAVITLIKRVDHKKKMVGALCAAPIVLEKARIIQGKKITSHPTVQKSILSADHRQSRVETDEHIITGQACGSAMEFAFALVAALYGRDKAQQINNSVLAKVS